VKHPEDCLHARVELNSAMKREAQEGDRQDAGAYDLRVSACRRFGVEVFRTFRRVS